MVAPIIPGINAPEIPTIIEAAAAAGALNAGMTIVRLNDAVADVFKSWLHEHFPDRAEKVLNQIAECHGGSLSDSRFGTRMSGEGNIAEHQAALSTIGPPASGRQIQCLVMICPPSGFRRNGCNCDSICFNHEKYPYC